MEQQTKTEKAKRPEEKVFYKHIVLAHWRGEIEPEIHVDAFLPLQWSEEMTDFEDLQMALEGKPERRRLTSYEKNAINGMLLRSKYVDNLIGRGLLIFDCSSKLTIEDIEAYLNTLPKEKLKETIEEAKMY